MDRDVEERVTLFCNPDRWGIPLELTRIALTKDQVDYYGPPENPAKQTDSRFKKYRDEFGDYSWELDALEPRVLSELVRDKVEDLRDENLWEQACDDEAEMKAELREISESYNPDKWFELWARRERESH